MSGTDRLRPWPGQPDTCTCTTPAVATLEETLGCPARWQWTPGTGWTHDRSAA